MAPRRETWQFLKKPFKFMNKKTVFSKFFCRLLGMTVVSVFLSISAYAGAQDSGLLTLDYQDTPL